MRVAILACDAGHVHGSVTVNGAAPHLLPANLADRLADGGAFPGERVVRLPRRVSRRGMNARDAYRAACVLVGDYGARS